MIEGADRQLTEKAGEGDQIIIQQRRLFFALEIRRQPLVDDTGKFLVDAVEADSGREPQKGIDGVALHPWQIVESRL